MRRYLPTLIILLALLVMGGFALSTNFGTQPLTKGYIPTLSTDSNTAMTQALILVLGGGGLVATLLGMAAVLAFGVHFATKTEAKMLAAEKAKNPPAPAAAKPAPAPKGAAPVIPFSTPQSLIGLWVVIILLVAAFLGLRAFGSNTPLAYIPMFQEESLMEFKIPGEPMEGMPEFIPGPGSTLTAPMLFVGMTLAGLGGLVVLGIGLARGIFILTEREKTMKAEPDQISHLLVMGETRAKETVESIINPKRGVPSKPIDQITNVVILVLFVSIAGIIAVYVMPNFFGIFAADKAVEATKIAASWTPTPKPGPTSTPLPPPADLFAALPAGDAAAGEAKVSELGCVACHVAAEPGATLIGAPWKVADSPDGKGVGAHAQERWSDANYKGRAVSAESYLLESIYAPNAFVVAGYQPNIMPAIYAQTLQGQDLANVIAYLLTLK